MTAMGFGSADKLPLAGGTLTGPLVLDGSPPLQVPSGAASGYVLTSDSSGNASWLAAPGGTGYLPEAGGTMTGTLILDGSAPVKIPAGAVLDYVLTSDGSGNASWQAAIGGGGTVSGQYLCTPAQYAPGTRTLLTATSASFTAFSSASVNTGTFTAPASGSVVVTVSFVAEMTSSAAGFAIGLAAHGTTTPMIGYSVVSRPSQQAVQNAYMMQFIVTGLTATSSYNLDLMGCVTSGDTLTVVACGQTSASPALGASSLGAPVTMTVQSI